MISKRDFLANCKLGDDFYLLGNVSGHYNENGTVFLNYKGNIQLIFLNISDCAAFAFDGKEIPCYSQYRIGERDAEGKISIFEDFSIEKDGIDEDEDGDSVYSKFVFSGTPEQKQIFDEVLKRVE